MTSPTWRLIRRRRCPPCERLEQYLRGYFAEATESCLEIVDVDSAPHLVERYGLKVPVLLRGDQLIVAGRWDRESLERALTQAFAPQKTA